MKLTLTTLVIIEDTSDNCNELSLCYHSFQEDPNRAKSEIIAAVNGYPIGWEWLDRVPLEDFTWLIEIFSTMTDNTDTYDFATFDKEATDGEPPYPVIEINRKGLANFLNEDQGYETGISMYGHYIACKCLDISSEREYMNQYTDIRILTNEIKPC